MRYNGENRKLRAKETKRKIYDSAAKLLSSNDYNKVSVDLIVKMAGVSKGSFYVHFVSKDALITSLISDYVNDLDTDYKNFLDTLPKNIPTESLLLALIEKITDVLIEKVGCDMMKVVYRTQITKDIDTDTVMGYDREIYKMFRDVLERGIVQGEFKSDMPLDTLAKHCMMAIRGVTYEWCIRYPEYDYKTQAQEHFKFILAGLRMA